MKKLQITIQVTDSDALFSLLCKRDIHLQTQLDQLPADFGAFDQTERDFYERISSEKRSVSRLLESLTKGGVHE